MFRRLNAGEAAHETTEEIQDAPRGPMRLSAPMPQAHEGAYPAPRPKGGDVTYKCEECGGDCLPYRERGLSTSQRRAAGAARSLRVFYAIVVLS